LVQMHQIYWACLARKAKMSTNTFWTKTHPILLDVLGLIYQIYTAVLARKAKHSGPKYIQSFWLFWAQCTKFIRLFWPERPKNVYLIRCILILSKSSHASRGNTIRNNNWLKHTYFCRFHHCTTYKLSRKMTERTKAPLNHDAAMRFWFTADAWQNNQFYKWSRILINDHAFVKVWMQNTQTTNSLH
jgi:hypothetical protein